MQNTTMMTKISKEIWIVKPQSNRCSLFRRRIWTFLPASSSPLHSCSVGHNIGGGPVGDNRAVVSILGWSQSSMTSIPVLEQF